MYRHGLYAIGAKLKSASDERASAPLGVFAIERFQEADYDRAHAFQIPSDARIHDVLTGAFGPHLPDGAEPHEVVVEFSAEKAHLVSSRAWHPTQKVVAMPRGRVRLTLHVPSLTPIVSWILEWGPHARAIEPPALVEKVRGELTRALALYEDS